MVDSIAEGLLFSHEIGENYPDVLNPDTLAALEKMAVLNGERIDLMEKRSNRRRQRFASQERIAFLASDGVIEGTQITVADARAGNVTGSPIP